MKVQRNEAILKWLKLKEKKEVKKRQRMTWDKLKKSAEEEGALIPTILLIRERAKRLTGRG